MRSDHILVITPIEGIEPGPNNHWREFAVECAGVTDSCREWRICEVADCPSKSDDNYERLDRLHDDPDAHGVEHMNIRGDWLTPTDGCYLRNADEMPTVAESAAERAGVATGRFRIQEWGFDDGDLDELVIDPTEVREVTSRG